MTQRERDEIHAEVDAEFEAVERGLHKKNKKKKKKTERKANETVDDLGSLFGDGISGKLPRYANKITLKVWSWKLSCFSDKIYLPFLWFYDMICFSGIKISFSGETFFYLM